MPRSSWSAGVPRLRQRHPRSPSCWTMKARSSRTSDIRDLTSIGRVLFPGVQQPGGREPARQPVVRAQLRRRRPGPARLSRREPGAAPAVRAARLRPGSPHAAAALARRPVGQWRIRDWLRGGAAVGGAPSDQRGRRLRQSAHRVDDGAVPAGHDVCGAAGPHVARRSVARAGDCRVPARRHVQGDDGGDAGAGRLLRPGLPVVQLARRVP